MPRPCDCHPGSAIAGRAGGVRMAGPSDPSTRVTNATSRNSAARTVVTNTTAAWRIRCPYFSTRGSSTNEGPHRREGSGTRECRAGEARTHDLTDLWFAALPGLSAVSGHTLWQVE